MSGLKGNVHAYLSEVAAIEGFQAFFACGLDDTVERALVRTVVHLKTLLYDITGHHDGVVQQSGKAAGSKVGQRSFAGLGRAAKVVLDKFVAAKVESVSGSGAKSHHAHASHGSEDSFVFDDFDEGVHDARVASVWVWLEALHPCLKQEERVLLCLQYVKC